MEELVNRGTLDQLVVYFAGHGFLMNYSEHWLLSKAPGNPNEAISFAESVFLAQQCGIPNVILISDACRSTPDSIKANQVRGSLLFPNQGVRPDAASTKVDRFYAALPGDPALEVAVGTNTSTYEGIYTSVFLDAFINPDADMVVPLADGSRVVPNRKLETFLRREVEKRAQQKHLELKQLPQTDVTSSDTTFIGRAPPAGAVTAAAPPPAEPSVANVAEHALANIDPGLAMTSYASVEVSSVASVSGFTAAQLSVSSAESGGSSTITTGFSISGADLLNAENAITVSSNGGSARILNIAINSDLRATVQMELDQPAVSIALRFGDGSGVVLACLRGFVGNIVVDQGAVTNVSYDLDGSAPDDFIRELRSIVAAAARLGVFRIQGEGDARDERRASWAIASALESSLIRPSAFTPRTPTTRPT